MESKLKKPTSKARIPDHLRRRALVSCDRCKKRRIRCLRPPGSEPNDACQTCLEVGVECESKLPRKTRIYGSVETLSLRYRVLDALIKGLFPQHDTSDIDVLYSIAESHRITLPAFTEHTVMTDDVFSHPNHPGSSPDQSAASVRSPSKEPETQIPSPIRIVEEKLVRLPKGPSHYIGPSSSFGFVNSVRNLVAEFNTAMKLHFADDERSKLSAEFAGSSHSKALEPINRDESEESSEDQIDLRTATQTAPDGRGYVKGLTGSSIASTSNGNIPTSKSLKRTPLLSLLPAKDVTDTFINTYFEKVHPNYLLFHRETFQNRYERMWAEPAALLRHTEPGFLCCICMMLVFGAQALEDRDKIKSGQIQRHYLDLVQSRMHQLLSAATLINVQALLLLQLYQHNCTERNSAFMLLGCASRMAMALGMHRGGTNQVGGFDTLEREVRKRVWWTAYTFEANQCTILGRPCAIDDAEVNVNFPNELIIDGGISVPVNYVEYSVRLTRLMSDIRRRIYLTPISSKNGDSAKVAIAIQTLMDLDSWQHSLPAQLRLDYAHQSPRHQRAVVLLHIQFQHVRALATRPFILRKVTVQLARSLGRHVRSQDLDKEELNLSHACGTFSKEAIILLHRLLREGMFDGTAWIDAYYIYHAVFILSLDFLGRPQDEIETEEDIARKKAVRDVVEALRNVKLCPTFTVLTQVSLQLSKIVGIFETQPALSVQPNTKNELIQPAPAQNTSPHPFVYDAQPPQPGVELAVNSWFQKEPVGHPWEMRDFFGVDDFIGPMDHGCADLPPAALEAPMDNTYNTQLSGYNDFVPSLPVNIGLTQWGAIDAPFAPTDNVYKSGG
ncbi:fungal-specific transcription factor domain-containing protein [Bisporella sp. PMI_857]|nr:fungal-specific transcription factor domain-containing protein [Bisporella sp. PMI_857]